MSLEGSAQLSGVVQPGHLPSLLSRLRSLESYSWLITTPNAAIDRLQGDFLRDFPTVFLGPRNSVLQKPFTVMLINNTCDLVEGRSGFVTVAPVFDFPSFMASVKRPSKEDVENLARDIQNNRVFEMIYVPGLDDFPNGAIVFLNQLCSVSSAIYTDAINAGKRCASFTQDGFYVLLIMLTRYLARSESGEVNRS